MGGRGQQRLLHRVLADTEIAVLASEGRQHARREFAEQIRQFARRDAHPSSRLRSNTGRTSTWLNAASGTRAAMPTASSRSEHSTR